jgi:hypothetical protein
MEANDEELARFFDTRDGHINSGIEGDMNEPLDLLEQVAVSIR